MATCRKCAATWTSPGMTLCPICGMRVSDTAPVEPSKAILEPEPAGVGATSHSSRRNGSAVLKADPAASASASRRAPTSTLPAPKPSPEPEIKITVFPKPQARTETPPPLALLPKAETKQEDTPVEEERLNLPKVESPLRVSTRLVDASVALLKPPAPEGSELPRPARPLNGPLILGALALIPPILLPLTVAFESNRILGVMGFCLSGFCLPFPPIAWIAGLAAEKRRREQGLQPERRVVLGRMLGQWGTLLLVAEVTALLILIAGLRLAGKLPSTFWAVTQF